MYSMLCSLLQFASSSGGRVQRSKGRQQKQRYMGHFLTNQLAVA